MDKTKKAGGRFPNHHVQTGELSSHGERMKQLSKSFGNLRNFKREIDEKLKGKLPKPSPRSTETRKLGETKISLDIDDVEMSLVTRDCFCIVEPYINVDDCGLENRAVSNTAFLPQDVQRLRDIARENSNFNLMRAKKLKVDDIVHTASKLEAEYLKRAKSPVHTRNFSHTALYGSQVVCEGIYNSEKSKPIPSLKKRTLVVKLPGISDNLNDYHCTCQRGRNLKSNFLYRHKR